MAVDAVAARYAEALLAAAKAESQRDEALEALQTIARLLTQSADVGRLLRNPDVEVPDKLRIIETALGGAASALVHRFLELLLSLGRAESLPDIIAAYGEAVDADRGLLRATVRSARPLPEAALVRLRAALTAREGRTVELSAEVDPALLGGLQVRLDHRVIDASVRRYVADLKDSLMSVRV